MNNCCICLENWIYHNALPSLFFFYNDFKNTFLNIETNSESSEESQEILDWEVMENSKSGF